MITQCGLETNNIVITVSVHYQYAQYYQALIHGLENYRRRGYQIALKFDDINPESKTFDLVEPLNPNYVSLSARNLIEADDNTVRQLQRWLESIAGLSILQQIDDKQSERLAKSIGSDWVEGSYYSAIPFDYLRNTANQETSSTHLSF